MDMTWTTELRRHYYVEISSTVTNGTAWNDAGLGLLVPGGAVMIRSIPYDSATQQFWRVRPVRPLAE